MQLSLFSLPVEVRQSVLWARPSVGCVGHHAVGLVSPVPPTVLLWLTQTCQVVSVLPMPSCVALLVAVPGSLSAAFHSLPQPRGGSRHPSNQLPW